MALKNRLDNLCLNVFDNNLEIAQLLKDFKKLLDVLEIFSIRFPKIASTVEDLHEVGRRAGRFLAEVEVKKKELTTKSRVRTKNSKSKINFIYIR